MKLRFKIKTQDHLDGAPLESQGLGGRCWWTAQSLRLHSESLSQTNKQTNAELVMMSLLNEIGNLLMLSEHMKLLKLEDIFMSPLQFPIALCT